MSRSGPKFALMLAYLVVGAIYTFPLVRHPLTTFPGGPIDRDVFGFLWNNWWIQHAVVVLHLRPDVTPFIFAPFGVDLRLHTVGFLYGLLSLPLIPLLGTVGVLSLQVLLTPALNGFAAYRLGAYISRSDSAGALAGLLVAGTPAINFHLTVGRPSCAAIWPALWAMYFLLRIIEIPSWRLAFALAASLVALLLTDQQIALFGLSWMAILTGNAILRGRLTRQAICQIVAVAAIAAGPALWLYWAPLMRIHGYTTPAASEALRYSLPVSMLLTPGLIWRVYGALLPTAFVLALRRARRDPERLVWLIGTASFVILTFGPATLNGRVPLPFALLRWLPAFDQFRTPYRFQIPAAIGFAMVAAFVVSAAARGQRRKLVLIGAWAFAVADIALYRIAYPVPVQSMPVQPVYAQIAQDPRDILVLEVPVGVRTGTDRIGEGEIFTFYQPTHGKRLINGFVARGPLEALAYYRSSPALMFLAHEPAPAGDLIVDLRRRLRELGVGYIVIHADRMDARWRAQALALFQQMDDLEPIATQRSDTIAFRRPSS